MAVTNYYVDPLAGVDAPGGGAIGAPWKKVQYALNTIVRNAVDGDQVNIKAGAADVLAATLTLATYGTPTFVAPLILRGYTAAANDGGIGEIDCGGFTMWASTYSNIMLVNLKIHTFGDNSGIVLNTNNAIVSCEVSRGASAPNAKYLIRFTAWSMLANSYIHDQGVSGYCVRGEAGVVALGNYVVVNDANSFGIYLIGTCDSIQNIVVCTHATANGIRLYNTGRCLSSVVYSTVASTVQGIVCIFETAPFVVINNIVAGFRGAGGVGISGSNFQAVGYNAFYNNTANYAITDQKFIDLTAFDVVLGADPFTNAAGGDFSLTTAAQAALRDVGWPAQYLGAAAATDGHITIGPIQYGAGGGGGGAVSISPYRGNL